MMRKKLPCFVFLTTIFCVYTTGMEKESNLPLIKKLQNTENEKINKKRKIDKIDKIDKNVTQNIQKIDIEDLISKEEINIKNTSYRLYVTEEVKK